MLPLNSSVIFGGLICFAAVAGRRVNLNNSELVLVGAITNIMGLPFFFLIFGLLDLCNFLFDLYTLVYSLCT